MVLCLLTLTWLTAKRVEPVVSISWASCNDSLTVTVWNDQDTSLESFTSPHLNCVAALPDKILCSKCQHFVYIVTKIRSIWASQSRRTSEVRSLSMSLYGVLEMTTVCTNIYLMLFTVLISSCIENDLVSIEPGLSQPCRHWFSWSTLWMSVW